MKQIIILTLFIFFMSITLQAQNQKIALVIHGGAGNIQNLPPALEKQYEDKMEEALLAGYDVLINDGTSIEAVTTAIRILENSPLFNAGKGAVFTSEGKNELDASIMEGKTLNAGAVAGVTTIKNPILAALSVMQESPHVLLVGEGAEIFAKNHGLEMVDPSYFRTDKRWRQYKELQEEEQGQLMQNPFYKFGTVGAVALDTEGNLVAGTSTGGMTNKKFGRVGDSPVIGAGTYADNGSCAVSATGHGEYFIRGVLAYHVSALMSIQKLSVKEAARQTIHKRLADLGGTGGVIALDREGNFTFEFNTPGMFRGYIVEEKKPEVFIYKQ